MRQLPAVQITHSGAPITDVSQVAITVQNGGSAFVIKSSQHHLQTAAAE
jgi:hypothetical protein